MPSDPTPMTSPPRLTYGAGVCTALLICFGLQSVVLSNAGGRAVKSESNYFSSLARLQFANASDAPIGLVGSSMTGRLPDQAQGLAGIANMGVDAGSAVETLRAFDLGYLRLPKVLVIEGNTLNRGLTARPSELSVAVQAPWFKLGTAWPAVSAGARPAAFVYSRLLSGRTGSADPRLVAPLPVRSRPGVPTSAPPLSDAERGLVSELSALLSRIKQRGTRVVVVVLPPHLDSQAAGHRLAAGLAASAAVPLWDLTEGLPPTSFRLTDGVHLDATSAAATTQALLQALERR